MGWGGRGDGRAKFAKHIYLQCQNLYLLTNPTQISIEREKLEVEY